MATLLYRLGHFATRRRWAVLIVWLVLLFGMGAAALAFSGTMTSSFTIPGTQAQAALDQLGEKIPGAGDATGRIVFAAPEGSTLAEPAYQQAIGTVVEQAKALPGVTNVIDPATAPHRLARPAGRHRAGLLRGSDHRDPGGDPGGARRPSPTRTRSTDCRSNSAAAPSRRPRPSAPPRASASSSPWSCC